MHALILLSLTLPTTAYRCWLFWNCVDEPQPDWGGMVNNLAATFFGQHIAFEEVFYGMKGHHENANPSKANVMFLTGAYGAGKNWMVNIVVHFYFPPGTPHHVIKYSGSNFIDHNKRETYFERLKNDIETIVKNCPRAIIIFDEIDKMPKGLIDRMTKYMNNDDPDKGVSYRKLTFFILANEGLHAIRNRTYEHYRNKLYRDDLTLKDFHKAIKAETDKRRGGQMEGARMIQHNLIDKYVPFMPLEKDHVRRCIKSYLQQKQIQTDTQFEKSVLDLIDLDEEFNNFAVNGCRDVEGKVRTMLARNQMNSGRYKTEL